MNRKFEYLDEKQKEYYDKIKIDKQKMNDIFWLGYIDNNLKKKYKLNNRYKYLYMYIK